MLLALDIRLARLTLRMERVELKVQTLVGRDSAIYGSAYSFG
jgi:hypothetical protein